MKISVIFIFVNTILLFLLCSYSWKRFQLTNKQLQKCTEIANVLSKHYDEISGDIGMLESKVLSKHVLNKIESLTDSTDKQEVRNFLNSKDVVCMLIRHGGCVRIEFQRRDPFLVTWQGYYIVFHTANTTKYGCPKQNPATCRLMPCEVMGSNSCKGQEHVTSVDSINNHCVFVTTRGYIGPPS